MSLGDIAGRLQPRPKILTETFVLRSLEVARGMLYIEVDVPEIL